MTANGARDITADDVKVISGPDQDGVVEIESGLYTIRFMWIKDKRTGRFRAKKIGFKFDGPRLKYHSVPDIHFKPAVILANTVFTGRVQRSRRRAEKRAEEEARKKESATQGTFPAEILNGTA